MIPQIDQKYRCKACAQIFDLPHRVPSDEGEYNACANCRSLFITPLFIVDGVEYHSQTEAIRAIYKEN